MDLKKCVEKLYSGKYLPQKTIFSVLDKAKDCFRSVPNIVEVKSPVMVVGDTHGQFNDLIELMDIVGKVPYINLLFLGDYVDIGFFSVEVFSLLVCLKLLHPTRITLLRGNHECRHMTQKFGFYDECFHKYGTDDVWKRFTEVFDYLPLCGLIDDQIFCVHGGLSPSLDTLEDIRRIKRVIEIPFEGGFCDLMWTDPEERGHWNPYPQGAGYTFGETVSIQFKQRNNVSLIARSHQIVMDGYELKHHGNIVTIFSAPNYCYQHTNKGALMEVDDDLNCNFVQFDSHLESEIYKDRISKVFVTGSISSSDN